MSNTSYAVSAKARSKYGRFLSDRDYESLLACQSVPEVMVYLKAHTHFACALSQVNERDVHRGWLEILLRQYRFNEIYSLCRYDSGVGAGFSDYVVKKAEAEQIIRYLILLNSNSTEKFIYQYPAFLSKHAEIDFNQIASAHDYDEFLRVLEKSSYYDILKNYKPDEKGRLPISEIEDRLYYNISAYMLEFIKKKTGGDEYRELNEIFSRLNDLSIISRIIRMKKYYQIPSQVIREKMREEFGSLSPKLITRMCEAETVEEVYKILGGTHYGRLYERLGGTGADIGSKVQYNIAKKYLHFSDNPSVVMISFILLSETELKNVISLIEGVRYQVDPKVIQSLLIR